MRRILPVIFMGGAIIVSAQSVQPPVESYLRRAEASCVSIQHDDGFGSGFLISEDGLLLTNFHVIEGATQLRVIMRSGKSRTVSRVEAFDRGGDLALLKISGGPYPYLEPVASPPQRGRPVYIFGHGQGTPWAFTQGYIVSLLEQQGRQEVQFSADISPGNSGGPVMMHESGRYCAVSTYIAWPEIRPGLPDRSRAFKFGVSYQEVDKLLKTPRYPKSLKKLNEFVMTIETACLLSRMVYDLHQVVEAGFSQPDEVVQNIPATFKGTSGYRVAVSPSFAAGAQVVNQQLQLFEGDDNPIASYPIRYDSVDRCIQAMRQYLQLVDQSYEAVIRQHGQWSSEPVQPSLDHHKAQALALEASRYLAGIADTHGRHMRPDEKELIQRSVDLFYRYRRGSTF